MDIVDKKLVVTDQEQRMPLLMRKRQTTIPINDNFYYKLARIVYAGVTTKIDLEDTSEREMPGSSDISFGWKRMTDELEVSAFYSSEDSITKKVTPAK